MPEWGDLHQTKASGLTQILSVESLMEPNGTGNSLMQHRYNDIDSVSAVKADRTRGLSSGPSNSSSR